MSFASIFGRQGAPLPDETSDSPPPQAQSHLAINMKVRSNISLSGNVSPSQNFYSDDDFDPDVYPPSGKRLAPVGAASNEEAMMDGSCGNGAANGCSHKNLDLPSDLGGLGTASMMSMSSNSSTVNNELEERLRVMEEEQEEMNTSLMSLTSHFAKVSWSFEKTPIFAWSLIRHIYIFRFS